MKAIVQEGYGPPEVLRLQDVEKPVVGAKEVLVRVRASTVHPDVWHVMTGQPYVLRLMGSGLRRPRVTIPGTEVAGTVDAVGSDVTELRVGDEVFGETVLGMQWVNGRAFAEYVAVHEECLAKKPTNVTFEQAASAPTSGIIALMNLGNAMKLEPGHRVLVNGAAGGVGSIAVQLAKAAGAQVTGVDHANRLDLVRAVGADHVIDYTRENFTEGDERYDLIFDIPGNHPFSACRRVLKPTGKYVLIGHDQYGTVGSGKVLGSLPRFFKLMALGAFDSQLPKATFAAPPKPVMMKTLQDLLAAGKLTPLIDRVFPLEQVPEAMHYLQSGRARGKIVISI